MNHQGDVSQVERRKEPLKITRLIEKTVIDIRFGRPAHPDQVGGDATPQRHNMRNHIAPQVRGCRIAVKKDDRIAGTGIHIVHRRAKDLDKL
jgi:hypothetical protein